MPEDFDPAEVLSLVFIYMTAYQMLRRAAKAKRGETALLPDAAGWWGGPFIPTPFHVLSQEYGTGQSRGPAGRRGLPAA